MSRIIFRKILVFFIILLFLSVAVEPILSTNTIYNYDKNKLEKNLSNLIKNYPLRNNNIIKQRIFRNFINMIKSSFDNNNYYKNIYGGYNSSINKYSSPDNCNEKIPITIRLFDNGTITKIYEKKNFKNYCSKSIKETGKFTINSWENWYT